MSENKKKAPSIGGNAEDIIITIPRENADVENVSYLEANKTYNGVIQHIFTGSNATGKYMGIEVQLNDMKTTFTTFTVLPIPHYSALIRLLTNITDKAELSLNSLKSLLVDLPIIFTVRNRERSDGETTSYFKTIKVNETEEIEADISNMFDDDEE